MADEDEALLYDRLAKMAPSERPSVRDRRPKLRHE
jgi:hypothetical protein